jgi:hypothetical protein
MAFLVNCIPQKLFFQLNAFRGAFFLWNVNLSLRSLMWIETRTNELFNNNFFLIGKFFYRIASNRTNFLSGSVSFSFTEKLNLDPPSILLVLSDCRTIEIGDGSKRTTIMFLFPLNVKTVKLIKFLMLSGFYGSINLW